MGGRAVLAELASYCQDPKVKQVLSLCKPSTQDTKPLAELCQEVGIEPGRFVGQLVATMWRFNLDLSKLVVAQSLPGIVAATAKGALEPDGYKDREVFLKHMTSDQIAVQFREEGLKRLQCSEDRGP